MHNCCYAREEEYQCRRGDLVIAYILASFELSFHTAGAGAAAAAAAAAAEAAEAAEAAKTMWRKCFDDTNNESPGAVGHLTI